MIEEPKILNIGLRIPTLLLDEALEGNRENIDSFVTNTVNHLIANYSYSLLKEVKDRPIKRCSFCMTSDEISNVKGICGFCLPLCDDVTTDENGEPVHIMTPETWSKYQNLFAERGKKALTKIFA